MKYKISTMIKLNSTENAVKVDAYNLTNSIQPS